MNNQEFRAFLDLLMCSDPWPVGDDGESQRIMKNWANDQARLRGYKDWVDAWHDWAWAEWEKKEG
jgi:hypothetical protein